MELSVTERIELVYDLGSNRSTIMRSSISSSRSSFLAFSFSSVCVTRFFIEKQHYRFEKGCLGRLALQPELMILTVLKVPGEN